MFFHGFNQNHSDAAGRWKWRRDSIAGTAQRVLNTIESRFHLWNVSTRA